MARRWKMVLVVAAGLVCACAGQVEAHLRDYLVNEQYYTAKKSEFEVELHNDLHLSEADQTRSYSSEHQVELEYGILDHLQLAYYEVFGWEDARSGDRWDREEFKLEAKLRFAEAGQWPADVALYLEYASPDGPRDVSSDAIEGKVILSRDFGSWNLIGNFIFEREINVHEAWQLAYTAGISYAVTPTTRLGLEVKESLGDEDEFDIFSADREAYLVPGVYITLTPHVRLLAGPAFGLTRSSDDLQVRTIVEVEF